MPDKLSPNAITEPAEPTPEDSFGEVGDTQELAEPLESSVEPTPDDLSALQISTDPTSAEDASFTAPLNSPLDRAAPFSTTVAPVADDTPASLGSRLVTGLLVTSLYAGVGLVIDIAINVVQSLYGIGTGKIDWLFLPILAVLGLIFGLLFGGKALDIIFAVFRRRDDDAGEDLFTAGILRALGLTLAFGVFGWLVMMLLI